MVSRFNTSNGDFAIVVPSKGRYKTCSKVLELLPIASNLYVHKSEVKDYSIHDVNIVPHDHTKGYGSVINGIIEKGKEDGIKYVVIIDDDMVDILCHVGNKSRSMSLSRRYGIISNAVQVMSDLDVGLYLFGGSASVVKYQQSSPYTVGFSLPRGFYILDTSIKYRFDENTHYFEDFDFLMDYMVDNKFVVAEQRFVATPDPKSSDFSGGANDFRGSEQLNREVAYLKRKWGDSISFTTNKSGNMKPVCNLKFKRS